MLKDKTIKARGHVEIFSIKDGVEKILVSEHNDIQYQGATALAAIMSGASTGSINTMYFTIDGEEDQATDGHDIVASDFPALTGDADFVRVSISPGVLSSTTDHSNNKITFTGIVAYGDTTFNDEVAIDESNNVTLFALVVAPDSDDQSQDMVYAAYSPTTELDVPADGALGVRWAIVFGAD